MKLPLVNENVGHRKACLAKTMIAVLENWRDDPNYSDVGFAIDTNSNQVYHTAYNYLNEGTSTCICPELPDPCECGWQYDLGTLLLAHNGDATLDTTPTHNCDPNFWG
jgi:hypothetical protein